MCICLHGCSHAHVCLQEADHRRPTLSSGHGLKRSEQPAVKWGVDLALGATSSAYRSLIGYCFLVLGSGSLLCQNRGKCLRRTSFFQNEHQCKLMTHRMRACTNYDARRGRTNMPERLVHQILVDRVPHCAQPLPLKLWNQCTR